MIERLLANQPGDSPAWYYGDIASGKIRHTLAFVVLGLCAFPFRARGRRGLVRALWACGTVALASEMLQTFTVTRGASVLDVAFDLGASLIGLRLLFAPPARLRCLAERGNRRLAAWQASA